ncbi:hypothetical protein EPR50_G00138390 [Perca flavescens]|uniref:Uncharacterized protein n=1 Tax=Perca flavescens TaxID=8167 RepID=A0A484CLY9_PERFV|nr:hypothetical protein EPR50_G00138390 [Perca flavescens]
MLRWDANKHTCTRTCIQLPVPESKILGKLQEGEGGGILHAGAAVPARLTPPRLCGARLGLLEERRLRALQTCVNMAADCQDIPEDSIGKPPHAQDCLQCTCCHNRDD